MTIRGAGLTSAGPVAFRHFRGCVASFSYQSSMPAAAGTPRYENEAWSLEVFGCGWCHPSPLDSGFRRNDEWGAVEAGKGGRVTSFSYQ